MAEGGPEQPPERVAAEADREEREQDVTEGLLLDRPQRALLVRDLAAVPDRQVEGEEADDPVDERPRDEPGARQDRERASPDEPFAPRARAAQRRAESGRTVATSPHSSLGRQIVIAAGCTFTVKDRTFSRSPPSTS